MVSTLLNKVSVLFPINTDQGPRGKAFKWVKQFYETALPEVEICLGKVDENKPFSRSEAINVAAAKATREIFAIADTDIIFDPLLFEKSIKLLENHAWVLPFNKALNITQECTEQLLFQSPKWPITSNVEAHERTQIGWGLMNFIRREHFEKVGGFDERFIGWGGEDDAFASSVNCVCGSSYRLDYTAYHLWHPSGDMSNYGNNIKILDRYMQGKEAILKEIEKRKQ
jgi:hypothetical protein